MLYIYLSLFGVFFSLGLRGRHSRDTFGQNIATDKTSDRQTDTLTLNTAQQQHKKNACLQTTQHKKKHNQTQKMKQKFN